MIFHGRLTDSTGRIHGVSVRYDSRGEISSQQAALDEFARRYPGSTIEITHASQ